MVCQPVLIVHGRAELKVFVGDIEILTKLEIGTSSGPLIGKTVGQIGAVRLNDGDPVEAAGFSHAGQQKPHRVVQIFGFAKQVQGKGGQIPVRLGTSGLDLIDEMLPGIDLGQKCSNLIGDVQIAGSLSLVVFLDKFKSACGTAVEGVVISGHLRTAHANADGDLYMALRIHQQFLDKPGESWPDDSGFFLVTVFKKQHKLVAAQADGYGVRSGFRFQ